ncbi:MAG TPA: hypothetical protein VEH06_11385 [Candidatus Bathyarchaeia archaeon]|nr:hypothetical protein [Candidatus Bathyarchaeia archaeon]
MSDSRQEYDINLVWFKQNYRTLKEQHKGKLCLVIEGKGEVFSDISELLERLKGNDMGSAVIQYIT